MTPSLALVAEGKKFMWDGRTLESRDEASRVAESYRMDNFEVRTVEEEGKFFVYTRRVVKGAAVTVQ
jgi:hypothetical protein